MSFVRMWDDISGIGRNPATGGYHRFVWNDADQTMREWFAGEAAGRGLDLQVDRNGNQWAWWGSSADGDALVIGSHLDSVPDGGAFDGPLGVVSAFAAIDIVRERGIAPRVPVAVAAFSDEEGARFGVACVGSQLTTGALSADKARGLRDVHGMTLDEAMVKAGRRPEQLGVDPTLADRVGVFVELHVEQGRALDLVDRPIAVASAIWPHGRWQFSFCGEANHAGTTRLVDRRDPMLAFASSVHAARSLAAAHDAVATFGKVIVAPNGANAIPSAVHAWLDARAADEATLRSLVDKITAEARQHAASDDIELGVSAESITPVVEFPAGPRERMQRALARLGDIPVLPTQAGHDAGILSAVVPTAMLFVRNPTGVSHSPDEFAEASDCNEGAAALADVMAEWVAS